LEKRKGDEAFGFAMQHRPFSFGEGKEKWGLVR
jgi:hypothetical protein